MTKIKSFVGHFAKKGNTIFHPDHPFLIVSRPKSKQTGKKTPYYLLAIDPDTGKRSYVSSLYPAKEYTYEIEYNRERYGVTISDDQATFVSLNSDVYYMELVPKNGKTPQKGEASNPSKKSKE